MAISLREIVKRFDEHEKSSTENSRAPLQQLIQATTGGTTEEQILSMCAIQAASLDRIDLTMRRLCAVIEWRLLQDESAQQGSNGTAD